MPTDTDAEALGIALLDTSTAIALMVEDHEGDRRARVEQRDPECFSVRVGRHRSVREPQRR